MTPRILVVDDEPLVRAMVVRALEQDGYDVVALADGVAGLEAATREPFDLVITNDCMPRMSGEELAVRLHQQCPTVPILHIGGLPRHEGDDDVAGEHHLDKPFGSEGLQQTVRALLGDRMRQPSA